MIVVLYKFQFYIHLGFLISLAFVFDLVSGGESSVSSLSSSLTTSPSLPPISVEQKLTSSWSSKGKMYYRYAAIVKNNTPKTLKQLQLTISKLYGPIWGVEKSNSHGAVVYGFPAWVNTLPAGKSMEFVYIHSTSPADIKVSTYILV